MVHQMSSASEESTSVDHRTISVVVWDSNGDSDCGAPGAGPTQPVAGR